MPQRCLTPTSNTTPVHDEDDRSCEPYEIQIRAQKGYRPSDWVERLMNFDEVAELHVDLVYPKCTKEGEVLIVRADLLDPEHAEHESRLGVFSQIMRFAKDNGHFVTVDFRLERTDPRLHGLLTSFLNGQKQEFQVRDRTQT